MNEKAKYFWYALSMKIKLIMRNPLYLKFYLSYYSPNYFSKKTDVSIISYPKSGRTWLEQIVLEALKAKNRLHNNKLNTLRDFYELQPQNLFIEFTHAASTWESSTKDKDDILRIPTENFAKGKVVFLYRDPRDVLVSSYYHIKYRTGYNSLTKDELLNSRIVGPLKIINFMNLWYEYTKKNDSKSIMVSYEKIQSDTESILHKIFNFCGISLQLSSIRHAINECEFNKMKEKEKNSNYHNNPWLTPLQKDEKQSFKVRSGKIGEHQNFFSPKQNQELNRIITDHLNPAFGY